MKKIFIIKSALAEKEGLTKDVVWNNVYAVKDEIDAQADCILFQNKSNNHPIGRYKFYYIYEELELM